MIVSVGMLILIGFLLGGFTQRLVDVGRVSGGPLRLEKASERFPVPLVDNEKFILSYCAVPKPVIRVPIPPFYYYC